jgi:hypothetical protein
LAALGLAPGTAAAATRYVDNAGADDNPACPQADPCLTIAYAITNGTAADEIVLDSGSYSEQVTLGDDRSLAYQDFVATDGTGPAVLDGGAGSAVTVPASGAGHIRGLTIRSNASSQVLLNGVAEVDSNTFDDPDATGLVVGVQANASGAEVHDNTFIDPAPTVLRNRAGVLSFSAAITVRDNTFTSLSFGLQVNAGGSLIEGNEFTGTHFLVGLGRSMILGGNPGVVTARENVISASASDSSVGISAGSNTSLVRNQITGQGEGVRVGVDQTGVSLQGDRIWGNELYGIEVTDNGLDPPASSAAATNVTVVDNGAADIRVNGSALTLDSSIIETIFPTDSTCTITYSRADAIGSDPSGCDGFQTTANPMLADAANGDLHLLAGSPMLDQGNPADPGVGAVDFDGDPRALAATATCGGGDVVRRDIGADELQPASADCDPPETTIGPFPGPASIINDPTPTITFSSDEVATFECKVDVGAFGPCSGEGEHTPGPLGDGYHEFLVRARDAALNTDPSPAFLSFYVDTVVPSTGLTKTPRKRFAKARARFKFEADEEGTFACRLDSRPEFSCDSPARIRVRPGKHVFRVAAIDVAGNEDPTPAKFRFRRVKR